MVPSFASITLFSFIVSIFVTNIAELELVYDVATTLVALLNFLALRRAHSEQKTEGWRRTSLIKEFLGFLRS